MAPNADTKAWLSPPIRMSSGKLNQPGYSSKKCPSMSNLKMSLPLAPPVTTWMMSSEIVKLAAE